MSGPTEQYRDPHTKHSYSSKTALHNLCATCNAFCKTWEVFDWVQTHHAISEKEEQAWPPVQISTVTHLQENQEQCHLCNLILRFLVPQRVPDIEEIGDMDVYLYARVVNSWEPVYVAVRLARDVFVERDEPESKYDMCPGFALGVFDGRFEHIYSALVMRPWLMQP